MEAAGTFELGDLVVLKSGGPTMTAARIGSLYDPNEVSCVWFVGPRKYEGEFPRNALRKFVAMRRPAAVRSVFLR
jgi:uncharacterized protein YodC (DUF2158 family)